MVNYIKISVLLLFISSCSSFQLNKHDGFWEWFIGKPGIANVIGSGKPTKMIGNRHPYYLWLRTPEVIFNPQAGLRYPDMIVKYKKRDYYTNNLSDVKDQKTRKMILEMRNRAFRLQDEGFVEYILPYREIVAGEGKKAVMECIVVFPFVLILILPTKMIAYAIHDVVKTVMIPVAAVYYTVKTPDSNVEKLEK